MITRSPNCIPCIRAFQHVVGLSLNFILVELHHSLLNCKFYFNGHSYLTPIVILRTLLSLPGLNQVTFSTIHTMDSGQPGDMGTGSIKHARHSSNNRSRLP